MHQLFIPYENAFGNLMYIIYIIGAKHDLAYIQLVSSIDLPYRGTLVNRTLVSVSVCIVMQIVHPITIRESHG